MANDKRLISPSDEWLTDATTGTIVGVLNKVGSATPESLFGTGSGASTAGVVTSVSASRSLTSADNGQTIDCSVALTLTIPTGLSTSFNLVIIPPDTGFVTITPASGVVLNNGTLSLTRNSTANSAVALIGRTATDAYKLTGS